MTFFLFGEESVFMTLIKETNVEILYHVEKYVINL